MSWARLPLLAAALVAAARASSSGAATTIRLYRLALVGLTAIVGVGLNVLLGL